MQKKLIIIRDDDVSYFTNVQQFQTVHRVLLENRIPFSAAVVPNACGNIPSANGGLEGFLRGNHSGEKRFFPVSGNEDLVSFFKLHPFIEIVQHGYTHQKTDTGLPEFAARESANLIANMEEGARILEDTFAQKSMFFVPPYDAVSRTAMDAVRKQFSGICLSRISRAVLPVFLWPKHWFVKKSGRFVLHWNGFSIVQHPGVDFSFMEPDISLEDFNAVWSKTKDVLVLPVHSWNFFMPDGKLKTESFNRWEKLVRKWISDPSVRFIRFSEIENGKK